MTTKINYTTNIVVLMVMLALLLGLILGGVFSIVKENSKSGFISADVSESTQGYYFTEETVLLSEVDYCTCDSSVPRRINPRILPDECIDYKTDW